MNWYIVQAYSGFEKKVVWSTKAEVIQTTIIVFIVVIVMSILLWLLDKLLGAGIKFLLA